jgi:hypothetical protein
MRGGARPDGDALVGHVGDVAQVGEDREPLPHIVLTEDVELGEAGGVVVGLGLDADAGDASAHWAER